MNVMLMVISCNSIGIIQHHAGIIQVHTSTIPSRASFVGARDVMCEPIAGMMHEMNVMYNL